MELQLERQAELQMERQMEAEQRRPDVRSESADWPKGLKRTKPRIAVMTALEKETLPVTALYLFEKLQMAGETIWLSTLYRVLESFIEKNAVLKIMPADSTMSVYEWNRHKHTHYAVCVKCHLMVPVKDCPFEHTALPAAEEDFHIVGHNLEIYGYCSRCYKRIGRQLP